MKSHAYVERIEDGIAVLELRLTPTHYVPPKNEKSGRRFRYPRMITQISIEDVTQIIPNVKERDVIVVEHTDGIIQSICYLDETETQSRRERAKARRMRLKSKVKNANEGEI